MITSFSNKFTSLQVFVCSEFENSNKKPPPLTNFSQLGSSGKWVAVYFFVLSTHFSVFGSCALIIGIGACKTFCYTRYLLNMRQTFKGLILGLFEGYFVI